jgi:hypothetical protein
MVLLEKFPGFLAVGAVNSLVIVGFEIILSGKTQVRVVFDV